jgi:hypothetical protein
MTSGIAFTPEEMEAYKQKITTLMREGSNVTLSSAIEATPVGKSTIYEWMAADEAFKKAIDAARVQSLENGLDLAENQLMLKVQQGDGKSIRYFLDRKGAVRGYNPKVTNEMTGPGGSPLERPTYILDFSGTPDVPTPEA